MAKIIRVMVAEDFPLLREDFCDVVSAQSDMAVSYTHLTLPTIA